MHGPLAQADTVFFKTLFELGTISDAEHTVVSNIRENRAYTGKVDFLQDSDRHLIEVQQPGVF